MRAYQIGFIIFLALLLRLPHLNGSFWLDEAAQAMESARPLAQQLDIAMDFQPPLIHVLVHAVMSISKQEWWLRTFAALIPGLVTIWASFKIGEKLISRQAGLAVALLLATNSFHIFYSQELRPYSLPTMFAVLSWLSLIYLKDRADLKIFALYGLATLLGFYSSYLYPFLFISQAAYMIWQYRHQQAILAKWFVTILVVGGLFVPWLPMFKTQLAAGGMVRQELPGWAEVVSIPQLKSLPLVFAKFVFGVLNIEPKSWQSGALVVMAILAAGIFWHIFKKNSPKKPFYTPTLGLLLLWLGLPLMTAWVVSFWIPVVQPKRVLFLLPAFYLCCIYLVEYVGWQKITKAFLGLLLAINTFSTFCYYTQPQLQRENWRKLHQYITTRYTPTSSVVVFSFYEPFAPWLWYDDGTYPVLTTGQLNISQVSDLNATLKPVLDKRQVLVFDYLRDLSDPDHKINAFLKEAGYTESEVLDYPIIGFVRVYSREQYAMRN